MEKQKILIADNEVNIRRAWKIFLESKGYEVHTAKDGLLALREIRAFKPDLLLLDLNMPPTGRSEGFDLLRRMSRKSDLKNIPVVIVTGAYTKAEVEEKVEKYRNVTEILVKDVGNEELLVSVSKALA